MPKRKREIEPADYKRDIEDPYWVAELEKSNLSFEIVIYERRFYNPDKYKDVDFTQQERQLLELYNKMGIMKCR